MIKIAILGFGRLGQSLFKQVQTNARFAERFEVVGLWNRTYERFEEAEIPRHVRTYRDIDIFMDSLEEVDLVVECAHPTILHTYATTILSKTHLFVSSPSAFGALTFYEEVRECLKTASYHCYIPLGASIGIWDVMRLEKDGLLKSVHIEMRKHPSSFKIKDPSALARLRESAQIPGEVVVSRGNVAEINEIAPQNTNTMAIYALVAGELGFLGCKGSIIADRSLDSHIIDCYVETHLGLKTRFTRDNPANHSAVTGKATFYSFLNSVYNYGNGMMHNGFVFC